MIDNGDITPWMPEPDLATHQSVGKLGEELAECSKLAFRIMIQGLYQSDPGTNAHNRQELAKELDDVTATILHLREVTGIHENRSRIERKLNGYRRWMKMIGA